MPLSQFGEHTKFSNVILCPYVSRPQFSQPDCQGTSGPNKVYVCVTEPLLVSLSAWPSPEVVLSLLLPPTALQQKAYTFIFCIIVCVSFCVCAL